MTIYKHFVHQKLKIKKIAPSSNSEISALYVQYENYPFTLFKKKNQWCASWCRLSDKKAKECLLFTWVSSLKYGTQISRPVNLVLTKDQIVCKNSM